MKYIVSYFLVLMFINGCEKISNKRQRILSEDEISQIFKEHTHKIKPDKLIENESISLFNHRTQLLHD